MVVLSDVFWTPELHERPGRLYYSRFPAGNLVGLVGSDGVACGSAGADAVACDRWRPTTARHGPLRTGTEKQPN